jgi:hypothetical protein
MSLENRKFPRFDVDLPAYISFAGQVYPGRINNVSLGGCLIEGDFKIPPDELVTISLENGVLLAELKAKVAWQTGSSGQDRTGVAFWDMSESEKAAMLASLLKVARRNHGGDHNQGEDETMDPAPR